MAKVEFLYNGRKVDVYCNEYDKFENIIIKFGSKIKRNTNDLCFLYGGQIINKNLTFNTLVNPFDRQRKIISVIVTNNYYIGNNNSFILNDYNKLKAKLIEANKIIEKQNKEIQEMKYQISMVKSEGMTQINSLMEIIDKKDKQIKQLNDKINKMTPNNLITIRVQSSDMMVNFFVQCLESDSCSKIEEKLYENFPTYRETNNIFIHNGVVIKRFKTIHENGIKNGDTLLLTTPE